METGDRRSKSQHDMAERYAGDGERCGLLLFGSEEHSCGAAPHGADVPHVAYDDQGIPLLQWNESLFETQAERNDRAI